MMLELKADFLGEEMWTAMGDKFMFAPEALASVAAGRVQELQTRPNKYKHKLLSGVSRYWSGFRIFEENVAVVWGEEDGA